MVNRAEVLAALKVRADHGIKKLSERFGMSEYALRKLASRAHLTVRVKAARNGVGAAIDTKPIAA